MEINIMFKKNIISKTILQIQQETTDFNVQRYSIPSFKYQNENFVYYLVVKKNNLQTKESLFERFYSRYFESSLVLLISRHHVAKTQSRFITIPFLTTLLLIFIIMIEAYTRREKSLYKSMQPI